MTYKLGHLVGDQWVEHSFAPVFERKPTSNGERLIVGVPAGDVRIFERLARELTAPYFLLYVLHTPRGEAEPGRYQSPEVDAQTLKAFLQRFSRFLSSDARFDIWIYSLADKATVVWDRHNIIYAYGPLDRYEAVLRELGFGLGEAAASFEHTHHYRSEFDDDAKAVIEAFTWSQQALRPEDEQ